MKNKSLKLLALSLITLGGIFGWGQNSHAQCCVTLLPPTNTASVTISSPFGLTGDFSAANNPAVFEEQVNVGNPAVPAGSYLGWCVDVVDDIGNGPSTYNTTMYSSCDPNLNNELPAGYPASVYASPENWHAVNYILNHKNGAYFWNIQYAIWYFVGGPAPSGLGPPAYPQSDPNEINALVNAAISNAPAWQSQCGDVVAVLVSVDVLPHAQLTIIEMPCCSVNFVKCPVSVDLGCNPATIPDCTGTVDTNVVYAVSCCSRPVSITCSKSESTVNCKTYRTLTYTAMDDMGHTATCQQTITWTTDTTGPVITQCAPNITVTQSQGVPTPDINLVSATDGCSTPVITWAGDVTNGVCPQVITRTYAATDSCGKTSTCTQTITVNPDGQIGDYVWLDSNSNGCQDAGEQGIASVKVDLYAGCGISGSPIASTTTDSTGHYLFTGLCLGTYTVSINTPAGYQHTVANAGCVDGSLPPFENQLDSKCDCGTDSPCGICVTLTAGNSTNLNVDCGFTSATPSLALVKTATPTNALPGQPVTYSYVVSNTGLIAITNINLVDDNGTPSDTSDDYLVNSAPFNLAPGESKQFSIAHITEPMCMTNNGTNLSVGNLTVNVLGNGDVEVFFNQSPGLNDNRYGTGATAATGWSKSHKFSDLVGSDEATFLFADGKGNAVLEFQCDYVSQATSAKFGDGVTITYPSGYGTLGPNGGDGKMLIGSASNVLSAHTTFSDSINTPGFTTAYKTNSPTETFPLSGISTPPGWNYVNGYHVVISHLAFGSNGFGGVTVPLVHNSPSKGTVDQATATNACSCVVNTATAYATQGTNIVVSATATAMVCFGTQTTNSTCNCTPHDIKYNFNGTQIIFQPTAGGSYVWFTSDGVVTGLPPGKTVNLHVFDQVITIPATPTSPQYVMPVPDSYITFDPSATVASSSFDTANNIWRIILPTTPMAGNVFYGGAAFKVPTAGLPGGIKNVDWSGSFATDTAGVSIKWQWHAANYSNFTSDYNSIAPKPTDDNKASVYKNSDLSGTPEGTDSVSGKLWKTFVAGGASGGGGANYTGSGSSTIQFPPCICTITVPTQVTTQ